jgi:cytochrome c biogenesis protein CcdA
MAAIFALGVLVSAGEFLCTGQIYLATILYLLRTGTGSVLAFSAFLCYTLAAALPPALLVILCHKGKQAMALSDFVRNRMPAIKIANSVFFAFFAVFAFFYF